MNIFINVHCSHLSYNYQDYKFAHILPAFKLKYAHRLCTFTPKFAHTQCANLAYDFKNIISGNIIINVKGCSLNFFPRKFWGTANAKITFERIGASVGRGELNAGTGIFKCGQAGEQLSLSNLILTILILIF